MSTPFSYGKQSLSDNAYNYRYILIRFTAGGVITYRLYPTVEALTAVEELFGAEVSGQQSQLSMITYIAQVSFQIQDSGNSIAIFFNANNSPYFIGTITDVWGVSKI